MGLGPDCWWGQGGLSARIKTKRKSIAQRPQRSQRGELRLGPNCWGGQGRLSARIKTKRKSIAQRPQRSQRGELRLGPNCWGGQGRLSARIETKRKSIARRPRRSQRGSWVGSKLLATVTFPDCFGCYPPVFFAFSWVGFLLSLAPGGDPPGLIVAVVADGYGCGSLTLPAREKDQAKEAPFRFDTPILLLWPLWPLCDAFPGSSTASHRVHASRLATNPKSPSVTSVASVRCFSWFSTAGHCVHANRFATYARRQSFP